MKLICTRLFKGYGNDTDEWRDYDEENVPFELLEKVDVPDEDSLEQRMNSFTVNSDCSVTVQFYVIFISLKS